jgi:ubiquinone biosynthesis monooxygenase Coq7
MRTLSFVDRCLLQFDNFLQTATGSTQHSTRINPAADIPEADLNAAERQHIAGLMRVNHVGEVCAQALYQGQALTSRTPQLQQKLQIAAREEQDHLAWCHQRLIELESRPSYLNPLWYMGSLAIGIMAGLAGDKISLGFLAETEHQVEQHLTKHLDALPQHDQRSRHIIEQMRIDEMQHAHTAEQAGAVALFAPVKFTMRCLSKIMTTTAYWI